MPQNKSAIKRVRQNKVRNEHNTARRSKMRTLVKKVLSETDKAKAETALKDAVSYLDRMSVKGIVHKNNAARTKARLTKHVNNL
ncbi:MAG: 30S ribosomal protein S20 [Balneolaceae bacterium]|nr:30S ribosomal protein S20 [Balneolaceae bacterium]